MTGSRHTIALGFGLFALMLAGAAQAQDLSAGKTPEQLFQLNCSTCHKSPRGLAAEGAKVSGLSGLEGFLAEHYTSDPSSAGLLAAYLKSVGGAAPATADTAKPHRKPRSKSESAKKSAKPDKTKTSAGKAAVETSAKPKSEKPKSSKAAAAADQKKPVSPSSEAKSEKPKAEKKTD